ARALDTTVRGTGAPGLVRLCHALDHLTQLHDDLTRTPPAASAGQRPAGFEEGAEALAAWLAATASPESTPDPAVFAKLEDASKRLSAEAKASRVKTLEDV